MQKYAEINENGIVIGFYEEGIHRNIPKNSIKIDHNFWLDFITNPNKWIYDFNMNSFVLMPSLSQEEKNKQEKISNVNNQIRKLVNELSQTDWYIHQENEENIPIPNDIKEKRNNLRKQIRENLIVLSDLSNS